MTGVSILIRIIHLGAAIALVGSYAFLLLVARPACHKEAPGEGQVCAALRPYPASPVGMEPRELYRGRTPGALGATGHRDKSLSLDCPVCRGAGPLSHWHPIRSCLAPTPAPGWHPEWRDCSSVYDDGMASTGRGCGGQRLDLQAVCWWLRPGLAMRSHRKGQRWSYR